MRLDHCASRVDFLLVVVKVVTNFKFRLLFLLGLSIAFFGDRLAHSYVGFANVGLRSQVSVDFLTLGQLACEVVDHLLLVENIYLRDFEPVGLTAIITKLGVFVGNHKVKTAQRVVLALLVGALPSCLGVEGQLEEPVLKVKLLVDDRDLIRV